jgi:hypothetical protein
LTLGQTENTQPVLLTHSSALLNALNDLNADYTMGHTGCVFSVWPNFASLSVNIVSKISKSTAFWA